MENNTQQIDSEFTVYVDSANLIESEHSQTLSSCLRDAVNTLDISMEDVINENTSENAEQFEQLAVVFLRLYKHAPSDSKFLEEAETLLLLLSLYNKNNADIAFQVEMAARNRKIFVDYKTDQGYWERIARFEYSRPLLRQRQSWDNYFMEDARNIAQRSTCMSGRRVGVVIVKDKVQLVKAFNGVPPKYPHPTLCSRIEQGCESGEGLDLCPCLHAEANAIGHAARHGISLEGAVAYVTTKPCSSCMGSFALAGVSKVVYMEDYPNQLADDIADHAQIKVTKYR